MPYDYSKDNYIYEDFKTLITKRKVHCKSNPGTFANKLKDWGFNYAQSDKTPNYFYLPWEWTDREALYCAKVYGKAQAYRNARHLYSPKKALINLQLIEA